MQWRFFTATGHELAAKLRTSKRCTNEATLRMKHTHHWTAHLSIIGYRGIFHAYLHPLPLPEMETLTAGRSLQLCQKARGQNYKKLWGDLMGGCTTTTCGRPLTSQFAQDQPPEYLELPATSASSVGFAAVSGLFWSPDSSWPQRASFRRRFG